MAATPLTFMGLLTPNEQAAITAAAMQSPQLMLWMLKLAAATEVDLNDPRTSGGLDACVGAGLLTAERVEAIKAAAAQIAPTSKGGRIVGVKNGVVVSAVALTNTLQIAPDRTFASGFNEYDSPVAYRDPDGALLYAHDTANTGWTFDALTQTFAPPAA